MEEIEVEMEDVESSASRSTWSSMASRLARWSLIPASRRPGLRTGDESRRGDRIAAREQGDVVAEIDQAFGQPPDDPLGAAIELGRAPTSASGAIWAIRMLTPGLGREGEGRPTPRHHQNDEETDRVPRFAGVKCRTADGISARFQEAGAPGHLPSLEGRGSRGGSQPSGFDAREDVFRRLRRHRAGSGAPTPYPSLPGRGE